MKLCPHCGESLEENAVRCRKCGGWVVGKKTPFTTAKRRRSGAKRLLIVAGLAALAWAVSSLPGNTIDPRELLDLRPSPEAVLQGIQSELQTLRELQEAYHRGVLSEHVSSELIRYLDAKIAESLPPGF